MSIPKVIAIVQARMGSTRFPKKVMKLVGGTPLIELLLSRLSLSKRIDQIIVATSFDMKNQPLVKHVQDLGYACFQGSEDDVLSRFAEAAIHFKGDIIVRITGDCPLVDPLLVDDAITKFMDSGVDYFSNVLPPTYPDGLDIEVFSYNALEKANRNARTPFDREHVTPILRSQEEFSKASMKLEDDLSHHRWVVDEPSDLTVIEKIFLHFYPRIDFSWNDVLALQKKEFGILLGDLVAHRNKLI